MSRFWICALLTSTVLLGPPKQAAASAKAEVGYTRQQVYSGALRYLRIDLDCEVTEKDDVAAYLLFRYQPQGQREASFGALEIIERGQDVAVIVRLPRLPAYYETQVRDGLVRKLQEDYGISKPRRVPPPPPEPPPKTPKPPAETPDFD